MVAEERFDEEDESIFEKRTICQETNELKIYLPCMEVRVSYHKKGLIERMEICKFSQEHVFVERISSYQRTGTRSEGNSSEIYEQSSNAAPCKLR